jgi:glycerate kinase
MKIVVATDSFKGCMTSEEAGSIIAGAFRESLAGAEIVVIPMADGGEGTTDAVLRATGGELVERVVAGPLGDRVEACFGLLPGGRTAVMEMASASGIELVSQEELDPMRATTIGTGELILAALDAGAREIILGVGGSATVDGGMGMAQALGWGLLTAEGSDCGPGGASLATLASIEKLGISPALTHCRMRVACDVTNPLLGPRGAARVFGPQKGASPKQVEELESGLRHLAEVWRREGLLDSVDQPGDGAAGGLGAGLRAFCRAELCPGAQLVAEITGFDVEIRDADLLVTGEGRTDEQTADGKLPAVLAKKARAAGSKTVLISGSLDGDLIALEDLFDAAHGTVSPDVPADEAVRRGRANLAAVARTVARSVAAGNL